MTNTDLNLEQSTFPQDSSRRKFLTGIAVTGFTVAALGMALPAQAAEHPEQPQADTGHDYPFAKIYPTTGADFGSGIIGVVATSKLLSGIGVDKAVNPDVKEFANFELRETIAVLSILAGAGITPPPPDALAQTIISKVESAPDFDKAFIHAQIGAHEWLRDTAEYYLKNSARDSDAEKHSIDVATLSLGFFKEHIVLAKKIHAKLV